MTSTGPVGMGFPPTAWLSLIMCRLVLGGSIHFSINGVSLLYRTARLGPLNKAQINFLVIIEAYISLFERTGFEATDTIVNNAIMRCSFFFDLLFDKKRNWRMTYAARFLA